MKTWQSLLLGFMFGVIASGILLLVSSPPRGTPIDLVPAPTPQPIVVYITGCVKQAGLYNLAPNSRVTDAIDAAGGVCENVNLSGINLAAVLFDGVQIDIPLQGETSTTHPRIPLDNHAPPNQQIEYLDINSASYEMIEKLPGIGPEKAKQIITYRQENGPFQTNDDLLNVPGIGESIFEQIKPYLIQK